MIDIHSHLIHSIDDGAQSLEAAIAQLKLMAEGGISGVFLTSHYFKGHYEYSRAEYLAKYSELASEIAHQGIAINLYPGFEVFLQKGIEEDVAKHQLTLADSRYVLIETELNSLPSDFYDCVFKLLRKGYKPILAHAERYAGLAQQPNAYNHLIDRDVYLQINAGSLLGQYGRSVRQIAWSLIDDGLVHFMGSDDHVRGEYQNYFDACTEIRNQYDDFTLKLLTKTNAELVLADKKVDFSYLEPEKKNPHKNKEGGFFRRIFG